MSTRFFCCGALVLLALPAGAQPRVEEVFNQEFYGGLNVTSQRLSDGTLTAFVAQKAGESNPVLAQLTYDLVAKTGELTLFGSNPLAATRESFDYKNTGTFDTEGELARQTVKSIALAALLLWEDRQAPFLEALTPNYGVDCPRCSSIPDGCSGWSQRCNGRSVKESCERHDRCYQCGNQCWGHTRAQCDLNFYQDVTQATNSNGCGFIYWVGVRGFGWLFYRYPDLRADMQHDVYYLGITLNGCPPGMYYLCTTYVM